MPLARSVGYLELAEAPAMTYAHYSNAPEGSFRKIANLAMALITRATPLHQTEIRSCSAGRLGRSDRNKMPTLNLNRDLPAHYIKQYPDAPRIVEPVANTNFLR